MKKNIFILIVVLLLTGIGTVYAVDTGGSAEGGGSGSSGGNASGCSGGGCNVGGNWGFRISLIIDGVTVKSINYANYPRYQTTSAGSAYTLNYVQHGSKIDAIRGNYSWTSAAPSAAQGILTDATNRFHSHFAGKTNLFTSNVGFKYNLEYDKISSYFESLGEDTSKYEELQAYLEKAFAHSFEGLDCSSNLVFLLLEPIVMVQNSTIQQNYWGTATEIARLSKENGRFSGIDYYTADFAKSIKMRRNSFVGQKSGKTYTFPQLVPFSGTPNRDALGYTNRGWGVGIVYVGDAAPCKPKCYDMTTSGNPARCTKTNNQNVTVYKNGILGGERECGDQEDYRATSEFGKRVRAINENCNVYCVEEGVTSFPGSVMPARKVGTNFVWPTLSTEKYALSMEGTRTCRVTVTKEATEAERAQCAAYRPTINDLYGDFQADVSMSYEDRDYGRSGIKLVRATDEKSCDGCGVAGMDRQIKVKRKVTFKLDENVYRYVNLKTGVSSYSKPSNLTQYKDIGHGNLPISRNSTPAKKYTMNLYNLKFGGSNVFGRLYEQLTRGRQDYYSCTYETTTDTGSCVCPPGTANEGKDLYCKTVSGEPMTCATAQEIYCDGESWTDTPGICEDPSNNKYCPDPMDPQQTATYEACVYAGNSIEYCRIHGCNTFTCPRTGEAGYPEDMDITSCVYELMAKGYTQGEALSSCKEIVCPNGGDRIIYRTIDLDRPFPSKNLNGNVAWANNMGLTNGRYPGRNWNSEKLVKSKILNNRNASGNALYSDKMDPIYVIDLNADQIEKIKRKNSRTNYADFDLKCETDGSACISDFLKDRTLVTGGTCAGVTKSNFYTCLTRNR